MSRKKYRRQKRGLPTQLPERPEPINHDTTSEGTRETRNKSVSSSSWLSILAIIVAGISAYFTYSQREEMRTGSQLDQRAWVGFFDETIVPAENGGVKFYKLAFTIKNTGKTPAKAVEVEAIEAPRIRDKAPTWEEIDRNLVSTVDEPDFGKTFSNYFPRRPTDPNTGFLMSNNKLQSDVLAPGATQTWNYELFRRSIDDKDRLRGYFLVRILYFDVFSRQDRTTKLCFMETIQGTVQHCPSGNSMD